MLLLVMTKLTWLLCMGVLGCSAVQETVDEPEDDDSVNVSEAVVTTGMDVATFRPTGTTGPVFPSSTRQLYLCMQIRTDDPARIVVRWFRGDDEEPFSVSQLTVTGDRWAAAGYEAFGPFESGQYVVRAETEGEPLVEVAFEVEGDDLQSSTETSANELSITHLRFLRELGDDGRPRGPITTLFPAGSREVHCAFSLVDAPQDAAVSVRWFRGSELFRTSDLGQIEGRTELQASLRASGVGSLSAGLYRAEIVVNGAVMRSGTFTVEEPHPTGGTGPRVTNLILTTSVEGETGLPTAPPVTNIRGDEPRLYLSMTFSRMPRNEVLEVRWVRGSDRGEEPFAISRFQVAGRGSLAAELTPESPLEIGSYRVYILLREQLLGTLSFAVDRPEPPPETLDEE